MPYSIYELIRYDLDEPVLEPTDTTIMLSNRTLLKFDGILRDIYVTIGSFVYPIDFHVISMPRDPFCPIILGRPFFVITRANIDSREGVIPYSLGKRNFLSTSPTLRNDPMRRLLSSKKKRL